VTTDFVISPFVPEWSQAVIDFIIPIQTVEFGVCVSLDDQPDLKDIAGYFQNHASNFWVAKAGGDVIGTIALKDIGGQQFALKKMFVDKDWRGVNPSVGFALLQAAIDWARSHDGRQVILGSTPIMTRAHRFYEKHGFVRVTKADLPPAFPIVPVDEKFYILTL
jgi:N-acetylglutamate synthase-like GNAT family acetyltransferase